MVVYSCIGDYNAGVCNRKGLNINMDNLVKLAEVGEVAPLALCLVLAIILVGVVQSAMKRIPWFSRSSESDMAEALRLFAEQSRSSQEQQTKFASTVFEGLISVLDRGHSDSERKTNGDS